ncbi:arrestin domain-containing protein 3-like [Polymixia lowei]
MRQNHLFDVPFQPQKDFMKLPRGTSEVLTQGEKILVRWKDNNIVTVATNMEEKYSETYVKRWNKERCAFDKVPQPKCINRYNEHMDGVDLHDQQVSRYQISIRSKKWWWPIFAWSLNSAVSAVLSYSNIEHKDRNIVSQGCQVYPFTFQIPARDLPSSFNGNHGKILYTLEANLSRPMRLDSKAKAQFNFVSKANLNIWPGLMTPQHGMKDKKMNIFGSGTVTMDVSIDKMGFYQGEEIKVVAYVQNRSSQEIKPKYCVYRKHSFFAEGKRKVSTKHILKEVGEAIPPSASQNVTKIITIPPTTDTSVLNCNVIKAEYRLKVYLDVKYASDPEIKFPIVILPPSQTPTVE